MPNQRDIARALGVNQATVSLAMRNDPSISTEMRSRVRTTAKKLGYHQNAFVTALMSHIRSGRKVTDKGTVAMLVDRASKQEWLQNHVYSAYYQGVVRRGSDLGFQVECFCLQAPTMNARRIDQILYARGIRGVLLAPPYKGNRSLPLHWERYACIGTGIAGEDQQFDRVANDHHQNVAIALRELSRLGYERIGLCLHAGILNQSRYRWAAGFLESQERLPAKRRIPLFLGAPGDVSLEKFRRWHKKWQPEVLVTISGQEKAWLDSMHLKIPRDIGMVCLALSPESSFAGVEERSERLGSTALELVAAKLALNEYGPPSLSKLILIEGRWHDGKSLKLTHRDED